MTERSSGQLLRVLGPAFAVAVGLGAVIGGGILRSPASIIDAVPDTGIVLALWLALGVQSLIEANVLAEVLTLWPQSGGVLALVAGLAGCSTSRTVTSRESMVGFEVHAATTANGAIPRGTAADSWNHFRWRRGRYQCMLASSCCD